MSTNHLHTYQPPTYLPTFYIPTNQLHTFLSPTCLPTNYMFSYHLTYITNHLHAYLPTNQWSWSSILSYQLRSGSRHQACQRSDSGQPQRRIRSKPDPETGSSWPAGSISTWTRLTRQKFLFRRTSKESLGNVANTSTVNFRVVVRIPLKDLRLIFLLSLGLFLCKTPLSFRQKTFCYMQLNPYLVDLRRLLFSQVADRFLAR